jgi:hypothetical protein
MPYLIREPAKVCPQCSHGYCLSYIREQSKRMKDRNTQYRLAQNTLMECAFDNWVPGLERGERMTADISSFVDHAVENARRAGEALENLSPSYFGHVEEDFFLTPQQIGKVRGDITEALCRTVLWNCAALTNRRARGRSLGPLTDLDGYFKTVPDSAAVALLTLGDSYDLPRLFIPPAEAQLRSFMADLEKRGAKLAYSTPDVIAVSLSAMHESTKEHFAYCIENLSESNQAILGDSVQHLEGRLDPSDVVFCMAVKTSIRSDRMYQFLFEANALKLIWRRAFGLKPPRFFSLMAGSYGADPEKLRGVDFTSIDQGPGTAERAIDQFVNLRSAEQLATWLAETLKGT